MPKYRRVVKSSRCNEYICENGQGVLSRNTSIVQAGGFADGEVVKIVRREGVSCLEELENIQEGAYTCLLLHSIVLSKYHSRIIVRDDDQDVLALLLYYSSEGMLANEVYMQGTLTRRNAIFQFLRSPQSWPMPFADAYHRCTPCQYAILQVPCIDL